MFAFEEKWMFPKCDKKRIYRHLYIQQIGKLIQVGKETLEDFYVFFIKLRLANSAVLAAGLYLVIKCLVEHRTQ